MRCFKYSDYKQEADLSMCRSKWILCPVCGNKTRTMIRENTEMKNFPLYCPKCRKETLINVKDMKITLAVIK
ncbi:cysteine-rich KTR domain-containing protein [Streptococcus suis]